MDLPSRFAAVFGLVLTGPPSRFAAVFSPAGKIVFTHLILHKNLTLLSWILVAPQGIFFLRHLIFTNPATFVLDPPSHFAAASSA